MVPLGPPILWTTLAVLVACVSLATVIGRGVARALPWRLASRARFYLAPALGLALLTLVATWLGRRFPMGDSAVVPLVAILLAGASLYIDENARRALRQCVWVSCFAVVCGIGVIVPLAVFGAFNAHNDAFTYLAQSDWLQGRPFGRIAPEDVTPVSSQIHLYEKALLRMGATSLLAFLQGLLNVRWAYEAYLALAVAAMAATCLAVGFAISGQLASMARRWRLLLLALPAFGFGSILSGADFGFLPQSLGILFGAAALFLAGAQLRWEARSGEPVRRVLHSIPCALLLSATVYAYPEIVPLIAASLVAAAAVAAIHIRAPRRVLAFTVATGLIAAALTNTESVRALIALRTQARVVVGGAVDWSPLGFLSHALGVHGGAWDLFQWSRDLASGSAAAGLAVLAACAVLAGLGWRVVRERVRDGHLLPAALALCLIVLGFCYFRYFVASPFAEGVGQSWNQFKLSEWAQPFFTVLVMSGVLAVRRRVGAKFYPALVIAFAAAGLAASYLGVQRLKPMMAAYGDVRDLASFYRQAREAALQACPADRRIYLALHADREKVRQMLALYLSDREVASNWTGDSVIVGYLPREKQAAAPRPGDCRIEPAGTTPGATVFGMFEAASGNGNAIPFDVVRNAHARETDGRNSWHWVERSIELKPSRLETRPGAGRTRIAFEFRSVSPRNLEVRLTLTDGSALSERVFGEGGALQAFDKDFEAAPDRIAAITITADGEPVRLGESDARRASFMLRNVRIGLQAH
jgi:hypothetical protein